MEQLMACRICLATDVPLYEMCKYQLKTAYENLTGFHMPDSSVHHVCSYCGTMLNNYSSFKEKCTRSQQVLDMLIKQNLSITPCLIKTIDRYSHKLTLPYTTHYIQNNNSYRIQNVDSAVKMNKFDTPVTSQNYDSVVSLQNFNSLITSQRFSIVTVKEEKSQIKSDNDEYYDYSFDYNNDVENVNSDFNDENYKDAKQKCDSDEEPLAKKIKKKQKKSKVKLHKHSVNLSKYDEVDVKTEDRQHFSINDQNILTNDQNLPIQNLNLQENIQYLETNDLNDSNQVQDLEIDHKLVILSEKEQIEEVLSRKLSANYLNSVHKCESCFKGFMTEATYKNHMARHEPCAGSVACPVCATRWPDARALRAHTLISHERRYICKVCGHISKSSHKAKEHTQWHAGVTFPCNTCGRSFTKSTSYLTHVRLRHATHVCAACGQSFIGENGLSMHKKKAHRDDHGEPSLYECHSCHVQFRSAAALRQHGELSGDGCDDTLHVCVQCGDHFASDQLLKEHKDMHLKTDALRTCSQCSRTFANERSLAAHVQRAHARTHARSPRHCVCEVCGYKCMSTSSLVNHQRVHSGEKPHACVHCHKRFSVAQRLQIHVRTHTGERPFQCTRCPKAFKHKAALNRHDRVHTGVKPYSCPQCGKSFSQSNSMKQHCAGVHMKTYIYSRRSKQ